MARQEREREDLLREATALVARVELRVDGFAEPIVCGFRRNGAASFYFGSEPVYQFNAAGLLRRAFAGGQLIKAESGSLVALQRQRSEEQVTLVRQPWSWSQGQQFLKELQERLAALQEALETGRYEVVGQVPLEADVVTAVRDWLARLPRPIAVARSPRVD